MPQLRVIPIDELTPDPDVQLEWAFSERHARRLIPFNHEAAGVLVVVPIPGVEGYSVIDGRHRLWAAKHDGVGAVRCDVHPEVVSVQQKANLKQAYDRLRRRVGALEHFHQRLLDGDPVAVEMQDIVVSTGYEIGRLSAGKPYTRISAITQLEGIHRTIGAERFRRALILNTHWRGEPKTNTAPWLGAMGLLARDGYDDDLTPAAWKRLDGIVPAIEMRKAQGEVIASPSGSTHGFGQVSYQIAMTLRKRARLKQRLATGRLGGHRQRPF